MKVDDPTSPLYNFEPKRNPRPVDSRPLNVLPEPVKTAPIDNNEMKMLASQCSVMAIETLAYFAADPLKWKGLALAASKELLDRGHGKAVAPIDARVVHLTLEDLVMASYKTPLPPHIDSAPLIIAPDKSNH